MDKKSRKPNRLKEYNYSANGYYFITICTNNKKKILCDIVECSALNVLKTELSEIGKVVESQLSGMSNFYEKIKIDKYVIMPNHIHLIIKINNQLCVEDAAPYNNMLSNFIGTFKRYTNKSVNNNLWQKSFYDHIIRDNAEYLRIWEYIDTNPVKWMEDKYYIN